MITWFRTSLDIRKISRAIQLNKIKVTSQPPIVYRIQAPDLSFDNSLHADDMPWNPTRAKDRAPKQIDIENLSLKFVKKKNI